VAPWIASSEIRVLQEHRRKDVIADAMLQQILLRPADLRVIANSEPDAHYFPNASGAEVGRIGIATRANLSTQSPCRSHPVPSTQVAARTRCKPRHDPVAE